ncbi:MAG: tetratricopeptide repeat protein [Chitinispirillia bacterium]|nr:tetratricopeptide repeat protein [Chitinispirillia bacterium]MCL2240903.1 tetratricopeptide repeat protein [Chitinispirillia bacterium]
MDIKQKKSTVQEGANPLVDSILSMKEFFKKNGSTIVACLVAAVIIGGGYYFYNRMKENNIRKAQEIFGVAIMDYSAGNAEQALKLFGQIANDHRNTPVATMSAFMAGSICLQQKNPGQAITWFEAAVNGPAAGFVRGQALEGLAAACEENGDTAGAIRYLERALRDRDAAHRHNAIRWRLALLNKDNPGAASVYCKDLIADTLAASFHQKAENLLAAVNAGK